MANEVNNETEASSNNEAVVSEQTNTNPSGEVAATEETQISRETIINAATDTAAEAPAAETVSGRQATAAVDTSASPAAQELTNSTEEDFGSILEKFEQEQVAYHTGDLVEGKVVGVSERGVLIDFGYKSEGIAPIEDFTSSAGEVTVARDDTVEVIIKSISSGDAPPQLSRADAVTRKSWDAIEKAFNEEAPITGHAVEVTKGGLRIDIGGVEAFMPGSQVDSRPNRNLNSFVGQDLEAKVIKFSRKRNNIVLSRKVLTDEVVNKQKAETLGNIEEGYIIEGTIKNITDYGAFIDIGGLDGLLHVTDMSWGRLQNPGEMFKVNDTVQVKVLKLDRENEKVALGYKQLIPDPWSTVMEVYPINSRVKGRVSSVAEYGAFVELEPGVEGLVHVSEMSWSKRSVSPKKLVHQGDEVEVQILGIDTGERRISLGMKQLQANPWQTVHERYHIGQTVRGKVRNMTDFGAFVEIEDGIDGLVHVSDISHSKKIKHPKDALKRDQEVEAVIRSIDTNNRRMSLSIKELTPSAWESFVATHKPGDVVRGRISRFTGFGVFVELGNELEGLCHISELSDERIERPEDIGAIGQEMDTQKIGLSARAVGKEDEPIIDTKSYSTEAKGGMASLGELMNLKRGEEETREEQPRLSKKERKALQAKERAEQEEAAREAEQNKQEETMQTVSSESENSATETADNQPAETAEATISGASEEQATVEASNEPAAEQSGETIHEDSPAIDETSENQSAMSESETESASGEQPTDADQSGDTTDKAESNTSYPGASESAQPDGTAVSETEHSQPANNAEGSENTEEKTANG
jgi:small subunit ribosomal protein S1